MMTINSEAPTTLNHLDDRVIELVYQSFAPFITLSKSWIDRFYLTSLTFEHYDTYFW